MDCENIVLSPKEVQNLLDCLEIIPSNHYICISRNIDNNRIYVEDLGKDGREEGNEMEITGHKTDYMQTMIDYGD